MSRSRAFCFTHNNYTPQDVDKLNSLECLYIIYGKEVAPTTGTPHLQGYVYFKNARSVVAVRKLLACHVEIARGTAQENFDYCSKIGDYVERGDRPLDRSSGGGMVNAERWEEVKKAVIEGRWDDIPFDIMARYGRNLRFIKDQYYTPKPEKIPYRKTYGIWVYGPPRTGKTRFLDVNYPGYYDKNQDQWFCHYAGESCVAIQEYDPMGLRMDVTLKKLVDRYPFRADRKHDGALWIRPYVTVITSNFSIEECFGGRNLDALIERFEIVHLTEKVDEATIVNSD